MPKYIRLIKKSTKKWSNIDFSKCKVEGYSYLQSSHARGNLSALITDENKKLISSFILLYNKKPRLIAKTLELLIDRRLQTKELGKSLLYKIYCNGFSDGYREIDANIEKCHKLMIFPSVEDCKANIKLFTDELIDLTQLPTESTKTILFWDYILELGRYEGAIIRGKLYEQDKMSSTNVNNNIQKRQGRIADLRTLQEMLTVPEKDLNSLLANIRDILLTKNNESYIAYLKIALEEERLISDCGVKAFHRALETMYEDIKIIKIRGVQDEYKRLTDVMEKGGFIKNKEKERKCIDGLKDILSN